MSAKTTLIIFTLTALTLAGTLSAEPPSGAQKERQVCRAPAKSLGSRIRTPRRCRTQEEWHAEDEAKGGLPISAQVTQGQNDGLIARQPR